MSETQRGEQIPIENEGSPEVSEADRLLKMADELLALETTDRLDLLTIKNIRDVKARKWPKRFEDETIIDLIKMYLREKPKLQKMGEQIKDHERKAAELRVQRKKSEEDVRKADEAVKNQLKKFGLK